MLLQPRWNTPESSGSSYLRAFALAGSSVWNALLADAAWLTHLTPLSFCSNVTFMMPTLTPLQALPMLQNSLISAFSAALTTFYYLLIMFTHEDARSTGTGALSLFLTS